MPAVQTANKKFRMDDASRLKGQQKISNWWRHAFELLKKHLEHMIPGVQTAEEKGSYSTNAYKWLSGLMREIFMFW